MKIALLPLDERPCNWKYIQLMTESSEKVELATCPLSIMGQRKVPGNQVAIRRFIQEEAKTSDGLVLSLDTLFYGGLIPSRTHMLTEADLKPAFDLLQALKEKQPNLRIYASITIMRSPTYNAAFEEPDYYEFYGRALHRRAYLLDKKERFELNATEEQELAELVIPAEVLSDYEGRRAFNEKINQKVLELVKEGVLDFLVIPQDDARPFGYTAKTQRHVVSMIEALDLESKVNIYPGADEVANTLVTRAYVDYYDLSPKIYPFFSSVLGPSLVPLYEDRPFLETLKYHVRACGARLVDSAGEADFLLAINTPGKKMQRAREQLEDIDITYTSYRNLNDFVLTIKEFIASGKKVAICDSAYGNGGDLSLMKRLDQWQLLDQLLAYAGWNTNANTLGTVLADGLLHYDQPVKINRHLLYRYLEDVCYQTVVRQVVMAKELPKLGVKDYALDAKLPQVTKAIETRLYQTYAQWQLATEVPIEIQTVNLPWQRLFEVDFALTLLKEGE